MDELKLVDMFMGDAVARGIPEIFRESRIEDCPESVRPKIEEWLKNPGPDLWLWGQSESGKSKIACAIALELLRRGMDVLGVKSTALCRALIDRRGIATMDAILPPLHSFKFYSPVSESCAYLAIEGLVKPSVLILDDLSMFFWFWPLAADLRPIFEARMRDGKITIVTSNLSVRDYIWFCDDEAITYLRNFTVINCPPGLPIQREAMMLMCKELVTSWEWMVKIGWLKPQDVGELVPRIRRIKQERVAG